MIDQSIQRFFIIAWLFLSAMPFIPIYLKRSSIKSKRKLIKTSIPFILFSILGIVIVMYFETFAITATDFQLVLLIPGVLLGVFSTTPLIEQIEVNYFQQNQLNQRGTFNLLQKSLKKMRARTISETKNETITAEVKGSYGTDFIMNFSILNDRETKIVVGSRTGKGTISRIIFFYIILLYLAVITFSSNSTDLLFPLLDFPYNPELVFAIIYVIATLFMVTENSTQSNIFFILDEVQKEVLIEMAKEAEKKLQQKLSAKEEKKRLKAPDMKMDLSTAKQKAEEIRQRQYKQELEERTKKVKQRVSGVIGKSEEDTLIDPELLKRKILIDKTKMILKSTPVYKTVKLPDIVAKVEHDKPDEVESIIIGLIDRKEVRGTYDIWEQIYFPGDTNSQFIEGTLRKMSLTKEDLEFIKVNKAGDVEIRFKRDS